MKNFKRVIALLLMIIFMMQPVAFAASVADFLDFPHDWSTEAMTAAVENGLYVGNNNKLIRPDGELTRAELAAFITRAFGATREASITRFTDVNAEDWYSAPIAKAYQMGAMSGTSETTFSPEANITREEVFLALARVLCISGTDESVLDSFSDKADISDWAKNGIIGLVADGYIKGYPNGTFRPKDNITRAELAQLFHNIFRTYIDVPGYHTTAVETGSVMIRVPGVRLENITINGDLVIADGVGTGNFDLNSVTVNGRILARGGEGKVTFKSVNVTDGVTVYDPNGVVNFNNYRTDAPFKKLNEITQATFLTKQPEITSSTTTPGRPSGPTTTYYTVRYYVDGELWKSESVRSGNNAPNLSAPEKVGHTSYWSLDKDGKTPFDFDTKITGARTLYAVYQPIPYEVTIKVDGKVIDTQTVKYGEKLTNVPANPEAPEGKYFAGWIVNGEKVPNLADYVVTGKTEIVADFSDRVSFKVTYVVDGKTNETAVYEGDKLTKPNDPVKEGWDFKHWLWVENDVPFDFDTPITADITLYAVYDRHTYTVTFMVGEDEYATADVLYKDAIADNMPADPTLDGYTFEGWFTKPEGKGDEVTAATVVTDDVTAYAYFVPVEPDKKVTVTFYSPMFGNESIGSVEILAGATIPTDEIPKLEPNKGYAKNGSLAAVYECEDYKHTIENEWWTLENGKWTLFDVTAPVYKDTDVYENYKIASLIVKAPRISPSFSLVLEARYRKDVRVIDTLKDALFINESMIKTAIEREDDKIWKTAVEKGVLDSETDKNILNQHRFVKLVTVIGKNNIEKYIWDFVSESVNESEELKDYIREHLSKVNDSNKGQVIKALDVAFDTILASGNANNFREKLEPIVADVLLDRELFLETLIRYVDSKVDTTAGKIEIWQLMNDALEAFSESDSVSLAKFIKDYTVKQVKADNQVFVTTVSDYIFDNIDDYRNDLAGYISNHENVSNEQFKTIILTVTDRDFGLVSAEIQARMKSDLDFAKTVFGKMLDRDNDTFKKLLREKIPNGANLPDAQLKAALDAYLKSADADIAELADAAITVLEDDSALRRDTITAYLDSIISSNTNERKDLIDRLCAMIADNAELKDQSTIKPVITDAIAAMIEDIDNYGTVIESFVRHYEYKMLVDTFVDSNKSDRDDALTEFVNILNDETIQMIAAKIMNTMFEAGKLDESLISGLVDYLAKSENVERLNEIVDIVLANVDGSMLAGIAAELGHDGTSQQVAAIDKLIRELSEEEQVTVNNDNVFMFEPILKMLKKYDFAFIQSKIPAQALPVLPMEDVERLYNRYYGGYINELETAKENAVKNPGTDYYAGSGVQIDLNPISDLFAPALDYVREMKMFAENKAGTSHRLQKYYDTYYKYYEKNRYIDALEEFLTVDKWLNGSDKGYEGEMSGYALKDYDSYYTNLKALVVILDDAMSWYYDEAKVPAKDREAVFAVAEHKVILAMNIIRNYVVDYATNGIPSDIHSFIASIESDPTLLAYLNRFGVNKYLEQIENNATANKVFNTAYEKYQAKLEARVEALLNKFVGSTLNRVYDEEEYDKMKNFLMHLFTTDAEDLYSVDSIFDIFFGGADAKQVEYDENTVTVSRAMKLPEDEI